MSFLQPIFLWALALLAVPVIIHLFNFRRYKKVIFSNVAMLKEIQTESRKTRQVKKWLILLTRILALAALILAFAQPIIPNEQSKKGRQLISLYLDNSESMRAEGENGQLFENGKNTAREILQNLPSDAEVQLLDNALSPYSNRLYSPEKASKIIDDLEIDYHPNDLNKIVQRINNKYVAEGFATQHTFAISDFQQAASTELTLDSGLTINVIPVKAEALQNLSVDSVWLDEPVSRPNVPIKLQVCITNNGTQKVESSTVVLKVNGVQQGIESLEIAAKSQKVIAMSFASTQKGWVSGELSITDVPVVFDNVYHFAVHIKPSINILQIGKSSRALTNIFGQDPIFNRTSTSAGNVDYAGLGEYDFIVLNELTEISTGLSEQLKIAANKGAIIALIPSSSPSHYAAFTSALGAPPYGSLDKKDLSIATQGLKHPFIADVYKKVPKNILLPKVKKCFGLNPIGASQRVLSLKDGSSILVKTKVGSGSLFQFAVPLDKQFSSLADHELFVLVMLKMAFSKSDKQQLAYSLFDATAIDVAASTTSDNLKLVGKNSEAMVEHSNVGGLRFWLNDETNEAGVYTLQSADGEALASVALNYIRAESKQRFATVEQLKKQLQGAQVNEIKGSVEAIKEVTDLLKSGVALWKVFIALCLVFLLIEILLLRFLKS